MNIHIGQKIKEEAKKRRYKLRDLAKVINTTPSNITGLFKRKSIDTDQLMAISRALDFNFFRLYSNHFKGKLIDFSLLATPDVSKAEEPGSTYDHEHDPEVQLIECMKANAILADKFKLQAESVTNQSKYISLLEEKLARLEGKK